MTKLDPQIIEYLEKKTMKQKSTIRKDISLIRRDNPSLTLNAAAQELAKKYGGSVLKRLDEEDRKSLSGGTSRETVVVREKAKSTESRKKKCIIKYQTDDYFINEHVKEINNAFNAKCFTSSNIMFRKLVENLIIDILRKKFPSKSLQDVSLYFDTTKTRFNDFSVILRNLYDKRTAFSLDGKKIIERVYPLLQKFKADANDKTHSWFHIITTGAEIEDSGFQNIIELVTRLRSVL
jgi:hypothetical protein